MRLDPATPRARLLLEVVRQAHAALPSQWPDCDAARQRLLDWVKSPSGSDSEAARIVPLPWSERTWRALLGEPATSMPLVPAILADRRAALLYHGLMGVDPATRDFLESRPKLRERLYERLAPGFAAFGRSLPVRDGAVVLPGGASAVPLWEELVGERATDPEAFITAALGKADGRLAFFLDTVAHLDRGRQAFALAAWERDRGVREGRVKALLKAFVEVRPEWRVAERPFSRPLIDPALVLLAVAVTPDGHFAPPAGRGFWEAVFRAETEKTVETGAARDGPPVDAAWIVGQTLTQDVLKGRDRLAAVSFTQRLFGSAPPAQAAQVARAARAFIEYRTAMIAAERIGATDPALFARVADFAASLADRDEAGATSEAQAVLALLERLRARDALSRERAVSLLDALVAVRRGDNGRYQGALTAWVEGRLLPAIGAPASTNGPEAALLDALAGRRADAGPGQGLSTTASASVTWEGVPYVVDLAGAERMRLDRVRGRQAGNTLDAALDLARRARQVLSATTPGAVQDACAGLVAVAASLSPVPWPGPGVGAPLIAPADLVQDKCNDLKGVKSAADVSGGAARQAERQLVEAADAVVTDALVSIAYALHVGDPTGAVDLAPDLARRHLFVMRDRIGEGRGGGGWTLPRERVGDGVAWHVEGSLLELEHALGGLSLRFLVGQEMPTAPRLSQAERSTLALGLALMNPLALTDADRDAIAAALARGRERLGDPARIGAELGVLSEETGWSEWRRESVRWAIAHDPGSLPALLTFTDDFWAGWGRGDSSSLAAWGQATTAIDGDLRLAWPDARPWEEFAGRTANGQLATRFIDLHLRVAEMLVQYRLPASLMPAVLAPALADLIHEAPLGHPDDWYALGAYVAGVPDDRLLDYIASVAAGGPLVPASPP
jgi:hypothetical protein